jgi:flagellar basal body-associated protein FliL
MAEEENQGTDAAPAGRKFDLLTILLLVNLLAVLGAVGTILYTKILYKKPKITNESATETLVKKLGATDGNRNKEHPLVTLEEMRVNLAPKNGENHYAVFIVSFECLDQAAADRFNEKRDVLVDKLIYIMNHKQIAELDNVQRRSMFKEEVLTSFNEILGANSVLEMYFSNFAVQ